MISPELILFIDWLDKRSTCRYNNVEQMSSKHSLSTVCRYRKFRSHLIDVFVSLRSLQEQVALTVPQFAYFSINQADVGNMHLQCYLSKFVDVLDEIVFGELNSSVENLTKWVIWTEERPTITEPIASKQALQTETVEHGSKKCIKNIISNGRRIRSSA